MKSRDIECDFIMSTMANVNNENNDNYFDRCTKESFSVRAEKAKECFDHFDKNGDGKIDEKEWNTLTESLFKLADGQHSVQNLKHNMFKLLDENEEGFLNFEQFQVCWDHWFKQVLQPVSALIIVDVQNDFISGSLAIKDCPAKQDGEGVVPVINNMLEHAGFDLVVYSCDWHPKDHISFIENVKMRKIHHTSKMNAEDAEKYDTVVFSSPQIMEQKLWPAHCVQGTWGAELHPDLMTIENSIHVKKGTNPDIDSYSAFWDNKKLSATSLADQLTERSITDVYVCGLAYDICVGATALHSLEHGFRTVLVSDASRGVCDQDIEATKDKVLRQGAVIVPSTEVPDMVSAKDRRPELGYHAALNVAMARRLIKEDDEHNQ